MPNITKDSIATVKAEIMRAERTIKDGQLARWRALALLRRIQEIKGTRKDAWRARAFVARPELTGLCGKLLELSP